MYTNTSMCEGNGGSRADFLITLVFNEEYIVSFDKHLTSFLQIGTLDQELSCNRISAFHVDCS